MREWLLALALVSAPTFAKQASAGFDWFDYRGDDGLPQPRPANRPVVLSDHGDPSFLARRQQHLAFWLYAHDGSGGDR